MKTLKVKSAKAQKGFTLVELSVVILVAGLMLTAVMKGQAMLETARAAKLLSEVKNVEALIGNFETAKGRLPGDCNSDGLIGYYLNTAASQTGTPSLVTATYGSTSANQTARALEYSNTGAPTTAALTVAGQELHCPAVSGLAAMESNANTWINDLRANNFAGVNTVPRLFAKHIGEDMMYVGAWGDAATLESYNAVVLANVPAIMAQRMMKSINGSDSTTDTGQIRVVASIANGTYLADAFVGTTAGSVVNLVYFFRNQPRNLP
jgi:prepilin-type N-terminal cleavage/methylation domain-containing protein